MLVSTGGSPDYIVIQWASPVLNIQETHDFITIIGTVYVDEVESSG